MKILQRLTEINSKWENLYQKCHRNHHIY